MVTFARSIRFAGLFPGLLAGGVLLCSVCHAGDSSSPRPVPSAAPPSSAPSSELSDKGRERLLQGYHALKSDEVEKHRIAALPAGIRFVRVDVSARIRSASFGHTTTLLVPAGRDGAPAAPDAATEFYIEYGKSTNTPGGFFGPFPLK